MIIFSKKKKEENRWKYIESCIKFSFLVIEDEFVSEDHINRLANSIKNEKNLRSIMYILFLFLFLFSFFFFFIFFFFQQNDSKIN